MCSAMLTIDIVKEISCYHFSSVLDLEHVISGSFAIYVCVFGVFCGKGETKFRPEKSGKETLILDKI